MLNLNNSDVSAQDIEYLKTCGILAPGRWPEEPPSQTQAEIAYAEGVAMLGYYGTLCRALHRWSLDKPQA